MKKVRLTIVVNEDLHEQFKDLAEKDKRSINSLINKLMQDHVDSQGSK